MAVSRPVGGVSIPGGVVSDIPGADGVRLPGVYAAFVGEAASQVVDVDNGMYDVLVRGPTTQEWKRAFVVDGTYTILPPTGDSVFTKAQFWGPFQMEADPDEPLATGLISGLVYNTLGDRQAGFDAASSAKVTRASRSPNIYPNHQGWTTDFVFNYTNHTNIIYKRTIGDWSVLLQNNDPFAGLIGSPNHMGDPAYCEGKIYIPVDYWSGSCGGTQLYEQIAVYSADDLSLISTHAVANYTAISGLAIDPGARIIYGTPYCDDTKIVRFNLDTFEEMTPLTVSPRWYNRNGIAFYKGLLYVPAWRVNSPGSRVVAVFDASGTLVHEYLLSDFSGTLEGIDFNQAGQFGVCCDLGSPLTTTIDFYNIPPVSRVKSGLLNDRTQFTTLVGDLPNAFTLMYRFVPASLYNFNAMFDSGVGANNYEGWIPSTGSLNARMSTSNTWAGGLQAGVPLIGAWSGNQTTGESVLYANGLNRNSITEGAPTAWIANTNLYPGSGNLFNTTGSEGILSYFYVFSSILSEANKQAIEADPSLIWRPTNALTDAQKAFFSGQTFDPDAVALIARMSPAPSPARANVINNLVVALKEADIWAYLDVLYLTAAFSSQSARLNWVSTSYTLTPVGAPTFTADRGYQGDGSTSYCGSGYLPATNGVHWTVNDASIWSWTLTSSSETAPDVGAGTGYVGAVISRDASGNLAGILDRTGTNLSSAIPTSVGMSGVQRRGANDERIWKNGSQIAAGSAASAGRPSSEFRICGRSPSSYSNRQISFAAAGSSLSGKEAAFFAAINAYMQAVGAA